jgi:hypothetical protein
VPAAPRDARRPARRLRRRDRRCTARGGGVVGSGCVGVVGRRFSMRSRSVGGTMRPARWRRRRGAAATRFAAGVRARAPGGGSRPATVFDGAWARRGGRRGAASRRRAARCGSGRRQGALAGRGVGRPGSAARGSTGGSRRFRPRRGDRLHRLDQARRRQRRAAGFGGSAAFFAGAPFLPLATGVSANIVRSPAARCSLARERLDELRATTFLDRARGALHLDA